MNRYIIEEVRSIGETESAAKSAMNKRTFLKTSGAVLTGGVLSRLLADDTKNEPHTNWSGNYKYSTDRVHFPRNEKEVQELVKSCAKPKALGARHSFDGIADTAGDQISLQHLNSMELDKQARTVTIGGGVKYGPLCPYLDSHGFALPNLASLPHVTVAGACATATHGSGVKNGNLSTVVSGMEFVAANGDRVSLSRARDGERFSGAVVHLGAIGILTKLTLDLQPAFTMRQVVYENLPFAQLENHLEEILASGYSVSLFTDWQNSRATQVWIKSRVENGSSASIAPEFFGAKAATRDLHPLDGHSAENCTEQMGVPGPWYERLPHFRMNFTPSSGQELQSEYFVPRERGYEAIRAVEQLKDHIMPVLFVSEIRAIAPDDLWMSMAHNRPSMALHFTWKPDWPAVQKVLPMIEQQLAPFSPRPHWAKLFTMPPAAFQANYERLPQFRELLHDCDPSGKFRNAYLNREIFS